MSEQAPQHWLSGVLRRTPRGIQASTGRPITDVAADDLDRLLGVNADLLKALGKIDKFPIDLKSLTDHEERVAMITSYATGVRRIARAAISRAESSR